MTMDKAKSALKMKISEYEMLNKTLLEMYERKISEVVIDTIKEDISETLDEINSLKDWIEKETDKDEKVEYSFYDGIKKPKLAKSVKLASFGNSSNGRCYNSEAIKNSIDKLNEDLKNDKACGELNHPTNNLYDSIKKDDKKNATNLGDYKPYDTPYNKLNFEDLYCLKFLNTETKEKYLNETITAANRFLVRFSKPFKINEWLVKGVDFDSVYNKELLITMQDHLVTREDGSKYPIISELRSRISPDDVFIISIDYLDKTGYTLYTERYHGCKIKDIIKSSLSYEAEGFNTIQLTVTFSDITYETSH
jgi:hypothetical protein